MKQYVLSYEQYERKLSGRLYEEEGEVFNLNVLLLEEISKEFISKIKKGKSIWLKHREWDDWKEYQVQSIISYDSGDMQLKLIDSETGKIWPFLSREFKDYDATVYNPWETMKGGSRKVRGMITQKELKQILRSYKLKRMEKEDAYDKLEDLLKQRPEIEEYVMVRFGKEKDDVIDFLYTFVHERI